MNGGKDVKFGDDKRPVSIVPSNEQSLYNIANGEILTDEFGNPLITEVDTFYLPDATAERSTSVVLPTKESAFSRPLAQSTGQATFQYADLDTHVFPNVLLVNGSTTVSVGETVLLADGVSTVTLEQHPRFEVRVTNSLNIRKDKLFIGVGDASTIPTTVKVGDAISGAFIPPGTFVSEIGYNNTRLYMSENHFAEENYVGIVSFFKIQDSQGRRLTVVNKHDPTLKVEEQFKETSEVSSTLLGVNRAEVQLSLFSNVSSYGLDPDEFETFIYVDPISFNRWDTRYSTLYGEDRYNVKDSEETQESAIRIASFSVPYSFPFGPRFQKLGIYNADLFERYRKFLELGNDLHNHFKDNGSYPVEWKNKFLPVGIASVFAGDAVYNENIEKAFAQIDTWTETWRDISAVQIKDPVTGENFDFPTINKLTDEIKDKGYDGTNTRPGYSSTRRRYAYMQSRRVFRYQPGRISGFTFGLRSSTEKVTGAVMEWGISNPTDQYVFRIDQGFLSIVRRSTIALEASALARSGLSVTDQERKPGSDPFDTDPITGEINEYWTINIPRDKFNGDPLNGNGPSGYLIKAEKVTMWKIEFGWYGAIGARFYAYIPADNGDARWVVIHTLVIENSLGEPCLRDSYFRFKYDLIVNESSDLRQPQFLYKYGASYYIDGGDEGTQQIFSANSGVKQIFGGAAPKETLIGIKPKDFILNSTGVKIINKKLSIPSDLNVTTDSLTEVKVETCRACPGFGHVHTPGIAKTDLGRSITIAFDNPSTIVTTGTSFFFKSDEGAKLISPSIWNAYIDTVSEPVGSAGSFTKATLKGYLGTGGITFGPRNIADGSIVIDSVTGTATTIGLGNYPHAVRLSQKTFYVSSDFELTGNKIEIQFINPLSRDDFGHFADFNIGITNVKPVTAGVGDALNGFEITTGVTTSVLPDDKILFGNYSHRYAGLNERGEEFGEVDTRIQPPNKLGIDFRVPNVASPAGGMCSRIIFEVQNSQDVSEVSLITGDEPGGGGGTGNYLQVNGSLPLIDYDGGQVTIADENGNPETTNRKFVGEIKTYMDGGEQYSYIEIDGEINPPTNPFIIKLRPITMKSGDGQLKTKLYNYNPYPLFFVAKMSDKSSINNISIKESTGDFQKTTSPKLFVSKIENNTSSITWSGSGEVTLADGNTSNTGSAPTNFVGDERLSGTEIDNQNIQNIRTGVLRDTFYVGKEGKTVSQQIDMSKVFGYNKRVIAPDKNNIEATFLTAKKIDSGTTGEIEITLNYKEQ